MIITACSRRKKAPIDPILHPANLSAGSLSDVADQWRALVASTSKPYRAALLYGGRAFTDAAWSARIMGVPHFVISAGLGLVGPECEIPAYSLTTTGSTDENVLARCPAGTRPVDWWRATFPNSALKKLIANTEGRVCLALPRTYLEMIYNDLSELDPQTTSKVRIFTGAGETLRGSRFVENIMPYDTRLDGPDSPLPGTKSDFASRALRHFTMLTQSQPVQGLVEDRTRVEHSLAPMRMPIFPKRERKSDEEIRAALIEAWPSANGNRQRLLRHLRDALLISCEQSRFTRIARALAAEGLV
ncbi:hypothetical protein M3484_20475 [Pseudomonas sp. GX19020]|uniref:hypothetical protein n=1 Tax=Pseudomonas sp. GX19020 TaxID=2942277 RepID=UPI0020191CF0|nr:hypothetical protein [Pseudomonas sp. GX19020]MCL4068939.1 hypothetical protein [Pseudomonas sp. GX19020]